MHPPRRVLFDLRLSTLALITLAPGLAHAGTITAQGNVTALDDVNQLQGIVGTADFDSGTSGASMSLTQYTAQGATWHTGALSDILAGVDEAGSASTPTYQNNFANFPAPIAGGGVAEGLYTYFGGAVTFSEPVTQVGLTAGKNGTQYLTVWDENGDILGQVTWVPSSDSAFIGLDTNGVPIGMVTYGNDNVWGGVAYGVGGATIMSDTWIWALGTPCESDADCVENDNPCTLAACVDGACVQEVDPDGVCEDDGNACTDDLCQAGECVHPTNEDPCDDGNACTDVDTCVDGECLGEDIACDDMNICSQDSCNSQLGCVYEFTEGCCVSDEDCLEGEICHFGSNSCIPDPDPDGDDTTDESTEDSGEDTEGSTEDSGTTEDSDSGSSSSDDSGDTAGESGEDSSSGGSGEDDVGDDTFGGGPLDTFGYDDEGGEGGCSCATQGPRGGGLLGLFALAALGLLRRRRDD
ncbi:MYXO-CTERM sorting domain-containing protein [Pseudenhygromyxa sp. WMMC2535]|uniref:MYXO-CTERM sorting domain-containing protein n=1 Tax=Pseudenhygromyxa sp. WMMC2535 TaxID=2712867 RepID=UPI001557A513|nr:MYXO-CTERM sorting domain-containing protein [Pseudenhygromyxa sp. WMMC2535]NVB37224.1 MYXO-CTERM sorting domain-containing protein [Pseudenhygromyxa sp. WMMC2535]NVB43620.1 MYXO-CTERM sorting domain-containing protein [Pseudenhygromyxa sp. WMMC2535]